MMQYYNARQSLSAIDRYMQLPAEHEQDEHFLPRPMLKGEIEFKNIRFTYPGSEHSIMDEVSFKIEAGGRVGGSGSIGSGKAARARLIFGWYEATDGADLVVGVDSRAIDSGCLGAS